MQQVGHLLVPAEAAHKYWKFHPSDVHPTVQTLQYLQWWENGAEGKAVMKNSLKIASDVQAKYNSDHSVPRVSIPLSTSPSSSHSTKLSIPITHVGNWQSDVLNYYGPYIYGSGNVFVNKTSGKAVAANATSLYLSFDRYGNQPLLGTETPLETSLITRNLIPLHIQVSSPFRVDKIVERPQLSLDPSTYHNVRSQERAVSSLIGKAFTSWEEALKGRVGQITTLQDTSVSSISKTLQRIGEYINDMHNVDAFVTSTSPSVKVDLSTTLLDHAGLGLWRHTSLGPRPKQTKIAETINGKVLGKIGQRTIRSVLQQFTQNDGEINQHVEKVRNEVLHDIVSNQIPKNINTKGTSGTIIRKTAANIPALETLSTFLTSMVGKGVEDAKKSFHIGGILDGLNEEIDEFNRQSSPILAPKNREHFNTTMSAHYIGVLSSLKKSISKRVKAVKKGFTNAKKEFSESYKRSRADQGIEKAQEKKVKAELKVAKLRAAIQESKNRSGERIAGNSLPPADEPPPPPSKPASTFIGGDIFMPDADTVRSEEYDASAEEYPAVESFTPKIHIIDPTLTTSKDRRMEFEAKHTDYLIRRRFGEATVADHVPADRDGSEPTQGEPGEPARENFVETVQTHIGCNVCLSESCETCPRCDECRVCCKGKGSGFMCYKVEREYNERMERNRKAMTAALIQLPLNQPTKRTIVPSAPSPKQDTPTTPSSGSTPILSIKKLTEGDSAFQGYTAHFRNSFNSFKEDARGRGEEKDLKQSIVILQNDSAEEREGQGRFSVTKFAGCSKQGPTGSILDVSTDDGSFINLVQGTLTLPDDKVKTISTMFRLTEHPNTIFVTVYD